MKKQKIRITIQLLTCACFFLFIYIYAISNLFVKDRDFSEQENRMLAQKPETSLKNIFSGDFDEQFEAWFQDQFIHRDSWVQTNATIMKTAGHIQNNGIYFGRKGYLIQQHLQYDEKISANNLSALQEFKEESSAAIHLLIVPDACYGERKYLPLGAYNVDEKKWIADIQEQAEGIDFINITKELDSQDNYFKTDHHWNEKGARIAYEAIARNVLKKTPVDFTFEEVSSDFHGTMYSSSGAFWTKPDSLYKIIPARPNPVTVTYENGTNANSLYMDPNLEVKDQYTYYLDGNHSHVHIETMVNTERKALVIEDSFGHILAPYLSQEYATLDFIDLRYYHDSVLPLIDENTDVFVICSLESFAEDASLSAIW